MDRCQILSLLKGLRASNTEDEINTLLQDVYQDESKGIWTDFASLLAYHRAKKLGVNKQILEKIDFDYSGYKVDLRRRNEV